MKLTGFLLFIGFSLLASWGVTSAQRFDGLLNREMVMPFARPHGLRNRIALRMQGRRLQRKTVCYEMVGCFTQSSKPSPLKKNPESPSRLDTRFWLYTRGNLTEPQLLSYGDGLSSLQESQFDPRKAVKVLIHGFKGSGRNLGPVTGARAFVNLADVNAVVVDWEKGAAGPGYPKAVANTELVGRQLGLLLLDMMSVGVQPRDVHLVGFSLGAHVAAVASHLLRDRGHMLGRITGLDPASPLFKKPATKEARKLDASDAALVDVMHTDGSPIWTDGFGLLRPLGHVDFFPNGGREQPGCNDGRGSVVVSFFEGTVNSSVVCSHVRAWKLFLESLTQDPAGGGCQFTAWPCQTGLSSFLQGSCFPRACDPNTGCSVMGVRAAQYPARGPLYLVTRAEPPFCGRQLRATVSISERTQRTRGLLQVMLVHGNSTTNFKINCEFPDVVEGGRLLWGLSAAQWGSIGPAETPELTAVLSYQSLSHQSPELAAGGQNHVFIDRLEVADQHGSSWQYCGRETLLRDQGNAPVNEVTLLLTMAAC